MLRVLRTSATPNPLAIKFHMDQRVVSQGSRSYTSPEKAEVNEAARRLFQLEGVTSVFYIQDVVTVNKTRDSDWNELIPAVADILEEHLTLDGTVETPSGGPLDTASGQHADTGGISDSSTSGSRSSGQSETGSTGTTPGANGADGPGSFLELSPHQQWQHVDRLLDETVRPGLAGDGGGLELIHVKATDVQVHYEGACGSCPSATEGTLQFIEETLKKRLHPDIQVISV